MSTTCRIVQRVDDETNLVFIRDRKGEEGIMLQFRCEGDGGWYYQSLMWVCRGGKARYFKALVALYRTIIRQNASKNRLRYLAWADNRLKGSPRA
jgi:hypothetical protein